MRINQGVIAEEEDTMFNSAIQCAVQDFEDRITAAFNNFGCADFRDTLTQYSVVEHTLLSVLHRFRVHMNTYLPINNLPVEVLLLIFHHCRSANCGDAPTWASVVHPIITLSHVCQRWRAAALNDPNLWTTISALDHPELAALPVILARSKTLPLNLSIEWRLHSSLHVRANVMHAIEDHLGHVRSLHLHIRDEDPLDWLHALGRQAPLLETFELVRGAHALDVSGSNMLLLEHHTFSAHAPRLRRVALENIPLALLDSPAVFLQVTDLSVSQHAVSPQDIRALLASCPNVHDLSIAGSASASSLSRVPLPRRGGLWECSALRKLCLTDVNPRTIDLVLPHLPLEQFAELDIVHTDADLFSIFELAPESVDALVKAGTENLRSMALRGSVQAYPPRVYWDIIIIDTRGASRSFPLSRPQRHPTLLRALTSVPALIVSAQMWPMLADLLPDTALLAAQKLSLHIEDPEAILDLTSAALRPLNFSSLRRLTVSATTRKRVPPADFYKLLQKMIVFRDLKGSRLKKLTLKGVRHQGSLDDLYSLAQQVDA